MEALAVALIVGLVVFAVAEEVVRHRRQQPGKRPCPRCGLSVETGVLDCPHCGFDFRSIGT